MHIWIERDGWMDGLADGAWIYILYTILCIIVYRDYGYTVYIHSVYIVYMYCIHSQAK